LPIYVQHFDINQQASFFNFFKTLVRILSFFKNLLETRLSEAAGHLHWACKDVKRRIIVCKESGFRACERTGLSTVKGSQRPWMWPFFTFF
jgi:hypothetical protein